MTKTKMKAKEKLPVEKWPPIFYRMNRLGLESDKDCGQFQVFGTFCYIFLSFFRGLC